MGFANGLSRKNDVYAGGFDMMNLDVKIRGSLKFWCFISTTILCLSLFLSGGVVRAAQIDDLNATLDNLGSEISTTTAVEQRAGTIIQKTNGPFCSLLVGSVMTAHAGDTVVYPLNFLSGPKGVAALQADILLASGITVLSMSAGEAATISGKSVSFSSMTNRGIIFGLNQTVIQSGELVIAELKIDPAIKPGLYPIVLSNPVASDPLGNSIPLCVTSGILEVQ